jgi:hypothetical protein
MESVILEKVKNIGALCLFLNNPVNNKYLELVNSSVSSSEFIELPLSERIWYFVNKLVEIQRCDCGDKLSFIGFKNGYRKSCGKKECFVQKRMETCIEKYGVDNPKKSADIIEKEKENILKKYNGEHYMLNDIVREKFKNTMIENHGVEWAQQSEMIKNKSKETFRINPNRVDIISNRTLVMLNKTVEEKKNINNKKIESIINSFGTYENFIKQRQLKIKEASIKNYGVSHHFMSDIIKEKRVNSYKENITMKIIDKLPNNISYIDRENNKNSTDSYILLHCNDCDEKFSITRQLLYHRINNNIRTCLNCNPVLSGRSQMEIDISSFISDHHSSVINNEIIDGREIDIYLPELKLGFEFNGLYWHSELYKTRTFHLDKTNTCLNNGIQLIHIWEDDWTYKSNIVKSMIVNKLEKSEKIYARKCEIKEIFDNKLVRDFLVENHIQGFVGSKVKIGLYFNDELVSLMTFGNLRKSLGQKSESGSWELLRFCNKLNTSVIGGASKLFKYFKDIYNPTEVISYSDISRSVGNMYEKLGFKLIHNSEPNYYYIIDGIRKHRFNFRKDKLIKEGNDPNLTEIEIMHQKGIYRIFDCGMQKWTYKIN